MKVRVAHSTLPKLGEKANGDRPFFRQDDQGRSLIAVIDGLGHGYEAQVAALAALRYLSEVPLDAAIRSNRRPWPASLTSIAVCRCNPRISTARLARRSPPGVNANPEDARVNRESSSSLRSWPM